MQETIKFRFHFLKPLYRKQDGGIVLDSKDEYWSLNDLIFGIGEFKRSAKEIIDEFKQNQYYLDDVAVCTGLKDSCNFDICDGDSIAFVDGSNLHDYVVAWDPEFAKWILQLVKEYKDPKEEDLDLYLPFTIRDDNAKEIPRSLPLGTGSCFREDIFVYGSSHPGFSGVNTKDYAYYNYWPKSKFEDKIEDDL